MSTKGTKEFKKELAKGGELQKKLNEAISKYSGKSDDAKARFEEVILPIAKEAGYDISWEEFSGKKKKTSLKDAQLSDDELKNVAGGAATIDSTTIIEEDGDQYVVVVMTNSLGEIHTVTYGPFDTYEDAREWAIMFV